MMFEAGNEVVATIKKMMGLISVKTCSYSKRSPRKSVSKSAVEAKAFVLGFGVVTLHGLCIDNPGA